MEADMVIVDEDNKDNLDFFSLFKTPRFTMGAISQVIIYMTATFM